MHVRHQKTAPSGRCPINQLGPEEGERLLGCYMHPLRDPHVLRYGQRLLRIQQQGKVVIGGEKTRPVGFPFETLHGPVCRG